MIELMVVGRSIEQNPASQILAEPSGKTDALFSLSHLLPPPRHQIYGIALFSGLA